VQNGAVKITYSSPSDAAADQNLTIKSTSLLSWSSLVFDNDASGGGRLLCDGTTDPGTFEFRDRENTAYADVNANTFNAISDIRLKKDITYLSLADYSSYLEKIRQVDAITYRFKNEKTGSRLHVGYTAQSLPTEVQKHFPSSGRKNSGQEVLGVSLTDMTGLLLTGVKAIDSKQQQLEKLITDQQQQIQQLRDEIRELRNK
jgi:hypothetical protein